MERRWSVGCRNRLGRRAGWSERAQTVRNSETGRSVPTRTRVAQGGTDAGVGGALVVGLVVAARNVREVGSRCAVEALGPVHGGKVSGTGEQSGHVGR